MCLLAATLDCERHTRLSLAPHVRHLHGLDLCQDACSSVLRCTNAGQTPPHKVTLELARLAGVLTPSSEYAFAQAHHSALILACNSLHPLVDICIEQRVPHAAETHVPPGALPSHIQPHLVLPRCTHGTHMVQSTTAVPTCGVAYASAAGRITRDDIQREHERQRGARVARRRPGRQRAARKRARPHPTARLAPRGGGRAAQRSHGAPAPSHAQLDAEHGRAAALGVARARAPGRGHVQRQRQRRRRAQEVGHRLRARGQHARA